ncbi:hypothetical protein CDL12_17978 [Handroanthus impetiginosus]|uniref:Uncharacterized protein n=1 Tax=Handroanthus impetiginosus TaxID=429701 RepID=A0A2G9GVY2_9LAMI|nr:hypothetical protein CDL12_17978 [Handroanthus impetiginosus]
MAHHQPDHLLKVAIEGFAIIDEYFPKRGAKTHTPPKWRAPPNPAPVFQTKGPQPVNYTDNIYQPQEPHVFRATRVSATETTVITAYQTTEFSRRSRFMRTSNY